MISTELPKSFLNYVRKRPYWAHCSRVIKSRGGFEMFKKMLLQRLNGGSYETIKIFSFTNG